LILLAYILIMRKPFAFSETILFVSVFTALFGTIIGHTLLNWSLPVTGATFVSLACLGETVITAIMAWLMFGEIPTAVTVIGSAICLVGVVLYAVWKGKRARGGAVA